MPSEVLDQNEHLAADWFRSSVFLMTLAPRNRYQLADLNAGSIAPLYLQMALSN